MPSAPGRGHPRLLLVAATVGVAALAALVHFTRDEAPIGGAVRPTPAAASNQGPDARAAFGTPHRDEPAQPGPKSPGGPETSPRAVAAPAGAAGPGPVAAPAGNLRPYDFPLHPGMPEWARLRTSEEMRRATQIPEDVLAGMDTASLVETCLRYPLILDVTAFGTLEAGFQSVAGRFNGLTELLRRPDAAARMLERYRALDPEDPLRAGGQWSGTDKARFFMKFAAAELFLARREVIDGLSSADRREVVREALRKYDAKAQHPDTYGFLGLSPCGLLMQRVMEAEGVQAVPGGVPGDLDREHIDPVLAAARRYAGE